jgi:hypothetical protein
MLSIEIIQENQAKDEKGTSRKWVRIDSVGASAARQGRDDLQCERATDLFRYELGG